MVRALRLATLICWVFVSLNTNAQQFDCEYLKTIYERLPAQVKSTSTGSIKSFPVRITTQNGVIVNIGAELTPKLSPEYSLIENFIERTTLEILLYDNYKDIVRVLEHNKTLLSLNGADFIKGPYWDISKGLDLLQNYSRFDISRDSLFYYAKWSRSDDYVSFRVPSNIQILTGKDKRELEGSFENLLTHHPLSLNDTLTVEESRLTKQDEIFVEKSRFFFVKDMNNAKYYAKDSLGEFNLIFSADYAGETFSNLFQEKLPHSDKIELQINQQLYGKQTKQYIIPLSNLISFAKANGFETFVGLENVSPDLIEATIVLRHKELNFIHMFHVKSSVNNIFSSSGAAMAARLYTYIPSDNIVDLFEEYKPRARYDELIPYLKSK